MSDRPREVYAFGRYRWDIDAALAIVADGRPSFAVPVDQLARVLGLMRIDREHVETTDVSRPILLAPLPGTTSVLPIDGWHRIARAVQLDLAELQAYVLTEAESDAVRLDSGHDL